MVLTLLVVPQEVNGNRNRAKAGVAVTGLHSLSFPKARCTEFKSRGGKVTFRATAMEKWPSWVQREVTGTPEGQGWRQALSAMEQLDGSL